MPRFHPTKKWSQLVKTHVWFEVFTAVTSGTWRHVDLVKTDVSEKHIASIFRKYASEKIVKPLLTDLIYTFLRNVGSYKTHKAQHSRRRHSSFLRHSARLSAHPNALIVNVMELPDNRRLRRRLPNDVPTRFLV
jgi:hypothetical protein